jgi:hypothetical protein
LLVPSSALAALWGLRAARDHPCGALGPAHRPRAADINSAADFSGALLDEVRRETHAARCQRRASRVPFHESSAVVEP